MSKEPKLCVLCVLGGKENFEAIALIPHMITLASIAQMCYSLAKKYQEQYY